MSRRLPFMLSVQSLQAFSATAIARGPGGVQRLAPPVQHAAANRAPSPAQAGGQTALPATPPRGALLDRVV